MIQYLKEHHLGKTYSLFQMLAALPKAEILEAIPTAKTLSPRERAFSTLPIFKLKWKKGVEKKKKTSWVQKSHYTE